MLWPFGIFWHFIFRYIFPVLVFCTKKNLATLLQKLKKRAEKGLKDIDMVTGLGYC
jgi:hypothetical protein